MQYKTQVKYLSIKVHEAKGEKLDGVEKVLKVLLKEGHAHDIFEYFTIFFLNGKNREIKRMDFGPGAHNENVVYPGTIAKLALEFNAVNVIMGHNHPSGEHQPSKSDILLTRKLRDALHLIGVYVLDHIVYSGSGYTSMLQEKII